MVRPLCRCTVWQGRYRAFGELTQESGEWGNPLRFPGQYADGETGWYQNYYRDYGPYLGRYVESDLIGLAGGPNRYSYAWDEPVGVGDPTGLIPLDYIPDAIVISIDFVIGVTTADWVPFSIDVGTAVVPYVPAGAGLGTKIFGKTCNAGKKVPNPFGKKGSPRHQAYVEDEVRNMQRAHANNPDVEVTTEVRIKGHDGKVRYIDAQAVNKRTGEVVDQVQVGRSNKNGTPVARERRATEDIDRATGFDTRYRPYDG